MMSRQFFPNRLKGCWGSSNKASGWFGAAVRNLGYRFHSAKLKFHKAPGTGSILQSSGFTRFHIKVPFLKVQVQQGSTFRFHIKVPRSHGFQFRFHKLPHIGSIVINVQVPPRSTVNSSGSTRFHIKVPLLHVQVPPDST